MAVPGLYRNWVDYLDGDLLFCNLLFCLFIVEKKEEEDEHCQSKECQYPPEAVPLIQGKHGLATQEGVVEISGNLGTDQQSHAVGDQYDETLGLTTDLIVGLEVDIDLTCNEAEVVRSEERRVGTGGTRRM